MLIRSRLGSVRGALVDQRVAMIAEQPNLDRVFGPEGRWGKRSEMPSLQDSLAIALASI